MKKTSETKSLEEMDYGELSALHKKITRQLTKRREEEAAFHESQKREFLNTKSDLRKTLLEIKKELKNLPESFPIGKVITLEIKVGLGNFSYLDANEKLEEVLNNPNVVLSFELKNEDDLDETIVCSVEDFVGDLNSTEIQANDELLELKELSDLKSFLKKIQSIHQQLDEMQEFDISIDEFLKG